MIIKIRKNCILFQDYARKLFTFYLYFGFAKSFYFGLCPQSRDMAFCSRDRSVPTRVTTRPLPPGKYLREQARDRQT